jgi:hypothetical protein
MTHVTYVHVQAEATLHCFLQLMRSLQVSLDFKDILVSWAYHDTCKPCNTLQDGGD